MLELSYEDFRAEIEAEMYGYEEIEETLIQRYFKQLDQFIANQKKSPKVTYKGKKATIKLKDESDLFMIVDQYLAAIVNEDLEKYYSNFSL